MNLDHNKVHMYGQFIKAIIIKDDHENSLQDNHCDMVRV